MRDRAGTAIVSSGLLYGLLSHVLQRPRLMRAIASVLRSWGRLRRSSTLVASHRAVAAVLTRPSSFSSSAHGPNLVAGDFVIGMDPGRLHERDRAQLLRVLPGRERAGAAAAVESRARLQTIGAIEGSGGRDPAAGQAREFDLIDDYLVWVAWRALGRVFPGQAKQIAEGGDPAGGEERARRFFLELRYLGAHLLVGAVAPAAVQGRAQASACALNGRIDSSVLAIETAWQAKGQAGGRDRQQCRRNAIGINWVGHPATVQAGALVLRELFSRPRLHRALAGDARALGAKAWTDPAFRDHLRRHVLELLRFRPVFPILTRDVPRDTWFEPAPGCFRRAKAGAGFRVFTVGAMFDRSVIAEPQLYLPDRAYQEAGDAYLNFGLGDRACPARHHVVEILTSALAGLLQVPGLRYAAAGRKRIACDGPVISHLRLAFGA
jgi:cytochrome P450